jgi:hypothetical protein
MEAKDVDMNIVFKWLSQQEDSSRNRVKSIILFPGSNSYFEIRDLSSFVDDGYSYKGKGITFEGENETGIICRYTIPILEYTQILREEKLNKIL